MKRQQAEVGVKYWDNQDFIDLQGEPLRALDGFFAQYGPCVVKGCEVTVTESTFDVAPGLAVLKGADHEGGEVTMIVPFEGVKGVSLPLYLTLGHTIRERVYGDGRVKPIAYDYYAKPSTVAPTDGTPFFEINETGTLRFVDVVQDGAHRFITDTQKAQWNAKETPAGAQAKADAALASADTHTDTRETSIRADFAAGDASTLATAKTDASTKSEATLRSAKTYTDQKDTVVRTDMATADTATLRSAKNYADTVVAALVDGSPEALNTLQELATALGNDPNFATTVMQLIGEKLPTTTFEAFKSKAWTTENLDPNSKATSGLFAGDLNNISITGFYVIQPGSTNAPPVSSTNGCNLIHMEWDVAAAFQMFFAFSNGHCYIRQKVASVWKAWVTVWDSGNFDPSTRFGMQTTYVTDLNNTPINAFWVSNLNAVNCPVANDYANGFTVSMGNNSQYLKQWCFCKDHTWFRQMNNGNWWAWTQVWDSGNLTPATTSTPGLMSSVDKQRIDSIWGFNIPKSGEVAVPGEFYNGKQVYAQRFVGDKPLGVKIHGAGSIEGISHVISKGGTIYLYGNKSNSYVIPYIGFNVSMQETYIVDIYDANVDCYSGSVAVCVKSNQDAMCAYDIWFKYIK